MNTTESAYKFATHYISENPSYFILLLLAVSILNSILLYNTEKDFLKHVMRIEKEIAQIKNKTSGLYNSPDDFSVQEFKEHEQRILRITKGFISIVFLSGILAIVFIILDILRSAI